MILSVQPLTLEEDQPVVVWYGLPHHKYTVLAGRRWDIVAKQLCEVFQRHLGINAVDVMPVHEQDFRVEHGSH